MEMNNLLSIVVLVAIVLVLVVVIVVAVVLVRVFGRKSRTEGLKDHFGPEYDHTVETLGGERKAQSELKERQKHVESLDIHKLTLGEHERYLAEWKTVQSKFVDQPQQAIVDADRLIMEVMIARNYPVSNFEQRAADLSVTYPELVSNYRAARVIALKNKEQKADTEELRQALIYYRSLFDELLEVEVTKISNNHPIAA